MMLAEERKLRDARQMLRALKKKGFVARLAGGCVRDRLMGHKPKDYDIATDALPEEIMVHFKELGFKVVPTGIEHGTVTVVAPSGPVEITTLRSDVETDGRHAKVEFGRSFRADAARRDFTINAMYENSQGRIYDYFGGKEHIQQKVLAFVGEAETRIEEDYLRILRLFRFWARFAFTPNAAALAAVEKLALGLKRISQERITMELWQTLTADYPLEPLQAMGQAKILSLILPEIEPLSLPSEDEVVAIKSLPASFRPLAHLVLMAANSLRQRTFDFQGLGTRLRLAGVDTKRLTFFSGALDFLLKEFTSEQAVALGFVDLCEDAAGKEAFSAFYKPVFELLFKRWNMTESGSVWLRHIEKVETGKGYLRHRKLPISGHDLMTGFGIQGRKLGEAMAALKTSFRNESWQTKEEGLAWLRGQKQLL